MSRLEQSGVDPADSPTRDRLTAGNRAYEKRFGRVLLIRAAGRSASEILAALDERLHNDPEREMAVIESELRNIAMLRLAGMLDS